MKVLVKKCYETEFEIPDDCEDVESYLHDNLWSPGDFVPEKYAQEWEETNSEYRTI